MTTRVIDLFIVGVHSALPAAAATPKGALFSCTTHSLVYRNDGTSWSTWLTLPSGAFTDPTTSLGDLIVHGIGSTGRFARGADNTVLRSDATTGAGLKWDTLDDGIVLPVAPNNQSASYIAALADRGRLVRITTAGASTFTIPAVGSIPFPLGSILQVAQQFTGQITITAGAGVTLRAPHGAKTSVQYAIASAILVQSDEWYVTGDVTT